MKQDLHLGIGHYGIGLRDGVERVYSQESIGRQIYSVIHGQ